MNSLAEENLGVAVVDDDPIYRELICATVGKKSKFVIFEASSGKELFDILATQRIDCIVLDYDLGEESGLGTHRSDLPRAASDHHDDGGRARKHRHSSVPDGSQ